MTNHSAHNTPQIYGQGGATTNHDCYGLPVPQQAAGEGIVPNTEPEIENDAVKPWDWKEWTHGSAASYSQERESSDTDAGLYPVTGRKFMPIDEFKRWSDEKI